MRCIMENEQKMACRVREDFHGLKICDLLPHLEQKRNLQGQLFLESLSRRTAHPPSTSKAADPPREKGRGDLCPSLPDSLQRLAVHQAMQHHLPTTPGSSSRGFRMGPTPDPANGTEGFSKAFTELFFLPYIAAGRPGVPCTEPAAAIRDLFQKGVLSSQILGEQSQSKTKPSSLRLVPNEPHANRGTSELYFENLEDLQRKLFRGTLRRSAGLLRPPQESTSPRRALRNICLSDSSMCCSPPLVCRNQIYYTSFSK